jgi:hypothetical protein
MRHNETAVKGYRGYTKGPEVSTDSGPRFLYSEWRLLVPLNSING